MNSLTLSDSVTIFSFTSLFMNPIVIVFDTFTVIVSCEVKLNQF